MNIRVDANLIRPHPEGGYRTDRAWELLPLSSETPGAPEMSTLALKRGKGEIVVAQDASKAEQLSLHQTPRTSLRKRLEFPQVLFYKDADGLLRPRAERDWFHLHLARAALAYGLRRQYRSIGMPLP